VTRQFLNYYLPQYYFFQFTYRPIMNLWGWIHFISFNRDSINYWNILGWDFHNRFFISILFIKPPIGWAPYLLPPIPGKEAAQAPYAANSRGGGGWGPCRLTTSRANMGPQKTGILTLA
jgi:hypothetical protein